MNERPLHLNFRHGQYPDPRLTCVRPSSGTHPGGWDFSHDSPVGALGEFPDHTARVGYQAGLLLENASSNAVRNPRAEGGVAGTPGTLPTYWSVDPASATVDVVGSGAEFGWPYVEIRLSGTPSGPVKLFVDGETDIAAIPGDAWTFSLGTRLTTGDLTNVSTCRPIIDIRSSSASLNVVSGSAISLDGLHRRAVLTVTTADGSTANVRPGLELITSGAVDLTMRIFAPQMELASFASSPILPPVGAPGASARSEDRMSLSLLSGWVRDGLTIITDFASMGLDEARGRQNLWSLDDGSFSNILNAFVHDSGGCRARLQRSGGNDQLTGLQWATLGDRATRVRFVVGLSQTDATFQSSLGEGSASGLSGALVGPATYLRLGCDPAGRALNGYLKSLHLIPQRLSDHAVKDLSESG